MAKYRKLPVEVEAVRYTPFAEKQECPSWYSKAVWQTKIRFNSGTNINSPQAVIETAEGAMVANDGDWIIRGVEGELYPCKDSVFQATYEEVK